MSKLLKYTPEKSKINHTLQNDRYSKIHIQSISSSEQNDLNGTFDQKDQTNYFTCESPLKYHQKKTYSEKKISQILQQPKSMTKFPLKTQSTRYKDLMNISEKRLAQSSKKIAIGNQTEKQSKKIKSFEIPFTFISQSVDLAKLNSNHEKSLFPPKMPDLLKIKLKKELQTIQKNQKPKKPHFMRNHNKSHLKRESTPLVFLQCQLDKFEEQKRHEKTKQKARKNIINERKFNNFKKVQKSDRREKASITIGHLKDTIDFKQWDKKAITEEALDIKYIGNHRNQVKYSRLLEYVKKPGNNSLFESPQKRKSRIKTQSALYSSLIAADVSILQLQGTKIMEQPSKGNEVADVSMMLIKSKLRNGRTTPVQKKPRINVFHKLLNSQGGVKAREDKYLPSKNQQISPWADLTQQCYHGLD